MGHRVFSAVEGEDAVSDETLARARALAEQLDDYAYKATLLAQLQSDVATRNALQKFAQGFRDARIALAAIEQPLQQQIDRLQMDRIRERDADAGTGTRVG